MDDEQIQDLMISGTPISIIDLRAEIDYLQRECYKMDKEKIVEELQRILSLAKNGYG